MKLIFEFAEAAHPGIGLRPHDEVQGIEADGGCSGVHGRVAWSLDETPPKGHPNGRGLQFEGLSALPHG
jgi:hypothetical protein